MHDNHQIDPPRTPEEGYHLTEDMVDKARLYLTDLRAASLDEAVLLMVRSALAGNRHEAPAAYIDKYKEAFDHGWDADPGKRCSRGSAAGLLPSGAA